MARIGGVEKCIRGLDGKLVERVSFESMDGKIILKLFLEKYDDRTWTELIWLRTSRSSLLL